MGEILLSGMWFRIPDLSDVFRMFLSRSVSGIFLSDVNMALPHYTSPLYVVNKAIRLLLAPCATDGDIRRREFLHSFCTELPQNDGSLTARV